MEKVYNGNSRKAGVYRIRNKLDGTPYIGSTGEFKRRSTEHERSLRNGKHQNPHLQPAWNLYGEDAFVFEVLEIVEGKSVKRRRLIEQKYIDEVWPNCYNVRKKTIQKQGPWSSTPEETIKKRLETIKRNGGPWNKNKKLPEMSGENHWNYGKHLPDETRKKMSETHKRLGLKPPSLRGKHHTEETKRKISEAQKGEKNHMYGKQPSEETRKKISETQKDKKRKPLTDEHKKKISEAKSGEKHENYGKHLSNETREKISKANAGKKRKPISEETRKKMSIARRKYLESKRSSPYNKGQIYSLLMN